MMSTVNTDDKPIDFSQRMVLGLDNPLLLPGFTDEYTNTVSDYAVGHTVVLHVTRYTGYHA